jgi:hypothetical protein
LVKDMMKLSTLLVAGLATALMVALAVAVPPVSAKTLRGSGAMNLTTGVSTGVVTPSAVR